MASNLLYLYFEDVIEYEYAFIFDGIVKVKNRKEIKLIISMKER